MGLKEQYLDRAEGVVESAAALLALDLTRGDPATFKAGYSDENALLAAADIFPEADLELVRVYMRAAGPQA